MNKHYMQFLLFKCF